MSDARKGTVGAGLRRALAALGSGVPSRRAAMGLAFGLVTALMAGDAAGRPGGGQSFSGGFRGYSGGGGGGFHSYSGGGYSGGGYHYYPSGGYSGTGYSGGGGGGGSAGDATVIVLLVLGFIVWAIVKSASAQRGNWSSLGNAPMLVPAYIPPPVAPRPRLRDALERLRGVDPDFSLVLFEDFLYALYATVHQARGAGKLAQLTPYLQPAARATLEHLAPPGSVAEVRGVVIGAMRFAYVDGADGNAPQTTVVVEFETNYAEVAPNGSAQTYYAVERWRLVRQRGARSRAPDKTRVFACPNCGAPLERVVGGQCSYCRQVVDSGAFDWVVAGIEPRGREARGPQLTGTVEEQGTDLPTVFDPALAGKLAGLSGKDPQFGVPGFQQRVALIFQELQVAWSSWQWERARGFLSDNLFEMQRYWVETYQRARLRNVTEGATIVGMELVRVTSDKYFDAITVRLHATGLDYTVAEDGRVVGGNRTRPRRYSEYWTLIRGAGRKGPAGTQPVCPNCGAPMKINMAGHCEYCRAKVTSGEFDWVLSRIEQDEAYTG